MSTLQVENLIGPTSGANANKVIIPSGQTLDASNGFVAPTGHVIQVKEAATGTSFITSSTTISATNLSQLITPKFQTSKFFIAVQWNANLSGQASDGIQVNIYKSIGGATATSCGDEQISYSGLAGQGSTHHCEYTSLLDTPNTASEISYQFWARSHSGTSERIASDWGYMRMIVMEIKQ